MNSHLSVDALLVWILLVLTIPASDAFPINVKLMPKASGMQGLRNIYYLDVSIGRVGPLSLLVDTGSPAVVASGDFGDVAQASSSNFLGVGKAGSSTIHYGGSTVSGAVSRSRLCFSGTKSDVSGEAAPNSSSHTSPCISNFPLLEVEQQDSGFSQLGLDGVLGLGPVSGEANLALAGLDETVLDGLANGGTGVPRTFGMYISPGAFFGSSMLSLGGYDASLILPGADLQFFPLAQPSSGRWELSLQAVRLAPADGSAPQAVNACEGRGDCRVLLDSGTAQLASVPQVAAALGNTVRNSDGGCVDQRTMPDIHIELAGGAIFKLGPEDYVLDRGMCTLAVEEMSTEELSRQTNLALILGEPFLQKVYAVFDQEQGRVGLAPSVACTGHKTRNEEARAKANEERAEHAQASLMNYISAR